MIGFLPLLCSLTDPPLVPNPPSNACTFESGTLPYLSRVISEERLRRTPAEKGMLFGSDSAGYGRSETQFKKWSATSLVHAPFKEKQRKERPIEERPGGRVRSADPFSPQ